VNERNQVIPGWAPKVENRMNIKNPQILFRFQFFFKVHKQILSQKPLVQSSQIREVATVHFTRMMLEEDDDQGFTIELNDLQKEYQEESIILQIPPIHEFFALGLPHCLKPTMQHKNEIMQYEFDDDESIGSMDIADIFNHDIGEEEEEVYAHSFLSQSANAIVESQETFWQRSAASLPELSLSHKSMGKKSSHSDDSPLQAFLRSKKGHGGSLSKTHHTATTQATDDVSIGSIDIFERGSIDDKNEDTHVDQALRITNDDAFFGFENTDDVLNGSSSSLPASFDAPRAFSSFRDSGSSSTTAFGKLAVCMQRSAQSRKLVKQLSLRSGALVSLSNDDSQRSLARLGSNQGALARGLDSSDSLSSSLKKCSLKATKASVVKAKFLSTRLTKSFERDAMKIPAVRGGLIKRQSVPHGAYI
jgi:hypothetical protein